MIMNQTYSNNYRNFDIIVHGASGFTGKLVVEYLWKKYGENSDLKWGISGRNHAKLQSVLSSLDIPLHSVQILIAESHDSGALDKITSQTKVVISTVGPYAKYGSQLVKSCVTQGTDYCDLAGELQWVRKMIDEHQEGAVKSGARIITSCGFDSIPSDIGVFFLQNESDKLYMKPCFKIKLLVKSMSGGPSGGTIASMMNQLIEGKQDKTIARIISNPYTLNPSTQYRGPDKRDQTSVKYDKELNTWTAPFVMAIVNTRVVRRTNAIMNFSYGENFSYTEAVSSGAGLRGLFKAIIATFFIGIFLVASSIKITRNLLLKYFLPKPGQGPNKMQREKGFYNLIMHGFTDDGDKISIKITGDSDPGYGSTSKMLAESAVCLALDSLNIGGGFWTPASSMGNKLLARLSKNAGIKFEIQKK